MTTNKPNKLDVRMRYVKTQAVELDCPAFKDKTAIFAGRIGEYTTTHEVFVPGPIVREMEKVFKNPKMGVAATDIFRQIAEAIAPLIAKSPIAAGVVDGASSMMGNMAMNMAAGRAVANARAASSEPEMPRVVRTPPDFIPPPDFTPPFTTDMPGEVDSVRFQNMVPKSKRSRKAK